MDKDMTEEQIAELREAFSMLDDDGNGRVQISELKTIIRAIDPKARTRDISQMMKEIDTKGNGYFDFDDFLKAMIRRMRTPDIEDEIYRAFKVLDKDKDGFISLSELRCLMTNMGEKLTDKEVAEMIKLVDRDKKGKVSFQDVFTMMTQGCMGI